VSRVGGPNEVAALSVGITIDPSGLDAGLAAAKSKIDTFNQQNQINVHGPGVGPYGGDRQPGQTGGLLDTGPTTSSIVGPGMEDVGKQAEKAVPKLVEVEKAGTSAFSKIGKALLEPITSFGQLSNTLSVLTRGLGTIGTAIAAATAYFLAFGKAAEYVGDRVFKTAQQMQYLKNVSADFSRVFDLQAETTNQRMDMRLAQAGIRPQARQAIMSERGGALAKEKAATQRVADLDAKPWSFMDLGKELLAGSFGILSTVGLTPSQRTVDKRLAAEQLQYSQGELDRVNKRIGGMIEGAPRGGFGNGAGGAVVEMSASNNRMDRREEAMNRKAVEEAMVEANRRR